MSAKQAIDMSDKQFNETCEDCMQRLDRISANIDALTKRSKLHAPPTRFDKLEASLSVLTFGFNTVRKQSDDADVKVNETIENVNIFKEQITELINGYVKRIDEAEQKGFDAQNALREREHELIEVKGQLRKQEREIEMLKRMIAEQREMMALCMDRYDKSSGLPL